MRPRIAFFLTLLIFGTVPSVYAQRNLIMSAVSADSMLRTLRELTGATPFNLRGREDIITTRYVYTTGNRIASEYIFDRMKSFGLEVESQHFRGDLARIGKSLDFTGLNRSPQAPYLWLCSDWGEIFRSTDSGGVWVSRLRSAVPDSDRLDWITALGSTFVVAMGKTGKMAISTDAGDTWVRRSSGLTNLLHFAASTSGTFVAVGFGSTVWRSSDQGLQWKAVFIDTTCSLAKIAFLDNDHAFLTGTDKASGTGRLYETTDAGLTWHLSPNPWASGLTTLFSTDPSHAWIGAAKGRCYSTNSAGATWASASLADSTESVKAIVFSDSFNGWLVTASGDLYRTADGGGHWSLLRQLQAPLVVSDLCFVDASHGVIVGKEVSSYRTRDGGQSWQDETIPLLSNVIATVRGTGRPGIVLLVTAHSDCMSRDGNTMLSAPGADDDASGVGAVIELGRILSRAPLPCTVKLITMPDEEVFGLGSAACAMGLLQGADTLRLLVDFDMVGFDSLYPGSLTMTYTLDSQAVQGRDLFKSVISQEGVPLGVVEWPGVIPANGEGFYGKSGVIGLSGGSGAGSRVNPHYHSQGDSWTTLNPVYYANVVRAVAGLLYDLSRSLTTADVPSGLPRPLPESYTLSQNYPNPFNPSTTIRYSLPYRSRVTLAVFNLLGQQVATLVNGEVEAGYHEVQFSAQGGSASGLASGVYVCRMTAGGFVLSRKMLLAR